ncbi:MAG: right-handed parallel beta-helix repeat-containing protein [Massilia sp.]
MKIVKRSLIVLTVLALVGGVAALFVLQQLGVAPRVMARYVERRAEQHNAAIVAAAALASHTALLADRGAGTATLPFAPSFGAQPAAPARDGRETLVASVAELATVVERAVPGELITLLPGHYRLGGGIGLARSGLPGQPIVLRARAPESVVIEVDTVQAFVVSGSDWLVENLTLRGICSDRASCDHAFHVVGGGTRFTALNNHISDFNAHFKINGEAGRFPDQGRIEGNTLDNSAARATESTVAAIDLVGANGWVIRRNLIRDIVKADGDRVSYGGYAKGAGSHNLFEQNVVLCESNLHDLPGARVGLSLGGGGSGREFCRDQRCIMEQEESTLRENLVAGCSDAGIYLNSAARSTIVNNTLLDTAGIDVRFAASTARLDGNLVDGAIRSRNDGVIYLGENMSTPTAALFLAWHPVRRLFADPTALALEWANSPPRRETPGVEGAVDLCGVRRPASAALGAFEQWQACRRQDGVRP